MCNLWPDSVSSTLKFNDYRFKMGLYEAPHYSLCGYPSETPQHALFECRALEVIRGETLGAIGIHCVNSLPVLKDQRRMMRSGACATFTTNPKRKPHSQATRTADGCWSGHHQALFSHSSILCSLSLFYSPFLNLLLSYLFQSIARCFGSQLHWFIFCTVALLCITL